MLINIAREIIQRGGRAFYTGGYSRNYVDHNNAAAAADIDIEVFHLSAKELTDLLEKFGETKTVGKIYPILKIKGYPHWDFSIAPSDSYAQAAHRRDFTVNAIMIDIISGEIMDHTGGINDFRARIIRHTTPQAFTTDPLRAYRGAVLAARMGFTIHPETLQLMRETDLQTLPPERIGTELEKLLMLAEQPSSGLRYLETTGILAQLHPRLYDLIGCEQEPKNHPEGDVWEHTLKVADVAAGLKHGSQNPSALMWAALLHDIGKPAVSRLRDGKIITHGHDTEGARLATEFMHDLRCSKALTDSVSLLIKEHMHPILLYKQKDQVTDKAIRKLANRVNINELLLLSEADFLGRGIKRDFNPLRSWLLERTAALGLEAGKKLKPLVQGRDLLQLGLQPGVAFKGLLDRAWEMQLDGLGKEEILQILGAEL